MEKTHPIIELSPFLYDDECSNIPQVLDKYVDLLMSMDDSIAAQSATMQQSISVWLQIPGFLTRFENILTKFTKPFLHGFILQIGWTT